MYTIHIMVISKFKLEAKADSLQYVCTYIYIYIQLGIVIFLIAFNFSENDGTIIGLLEVDIISSFIYIYFVRLCSAFYFYLFSPCDSGT